jgi:hypothetical protein
MIILHTVFVFVIIVNIVVIVVGFTINTSLSRREFDSDD